MNETHVQHTVGFVQHQNFQVGQINGALLDVIEQPARGGHHDIGAALDGFDLRVDADTAKDHRSAQLQMFAIGAHAGFHLRRQFACWYQHQRACGLDAPAGGWRSART